MVEQWDTEEFAALGRARLARRDQRRRRLARAAGATPRPGSTPASTSAATTSPTSSPACSTRRRGEYYREPGLTDAQARRAAARRHRAARRPDARRGARGLPRAEGLDAAPGGLRARRHAEGSRTPTPSPSRTSRSGCCSRAAATATRVFFTHAARVAQLPLRAQPGRPARRPRADARGRRRSATSCSRPRSATAGASRTRRCHRRDQAKQAQILVTYTENRVHQRGRRAPTTYRTPLPCESRTLRADRA